MARIVVLSDIHLSPTHGFFWENWCVARECQFYVLILDTPHNLWGTWHRDDLVRQSIRH